MCSDLVFYTNPMSRGRIVRWMLEEVGRPYRTEVIDYAAMKAPAYLAINPMGKVPALMHGDVVVTEAAAICAYLADAFADAGLAPPPSDPLRGAYYRWLFFAAGPIEASITNEALGVVIPDDRKRMAGYGSLDDVLATLETYLTEHEYIAGNHFTAADLYVGSHVGWGLAFKSIDPRPAFAAYWSRLAGRPAAIRARAIDDAMLAAKD